MPSCHHLHWSSGAQCREGLFLPSPLERADDPLEHSLPMGSPAARSRPGGHTSDRPPRTSANRTVARSSETDRLLMAGSAQSGYSSFRYVRGSSGWALGVRSRRKLWYGATNGSGAITV